VSAVALEAEEVFAPRRSLLRVGIRRFARRPVALGALTVLVAILAAGALAHVLVGGGAAEIDLDHVKNGPSLAHLFGTDNVGRDVLKRTVYGVRTTEEVALAAAGLASLIGVLGGLVAGYFGGWLDAVIMRVADLVTAYPAIVFTLAAFVYFRPVWPHTLILVFTSFMWAIVARAVRAETVRLRETEFVEAARALGASTPRILFRHVLPNVSGPIVVAATSLFGLVVLVDATVEFFGFGIPEAVQPSLGNLVADTVKFKFGLAANSDVAALQYGWWTWFFPGLVLVLILVCVNLVGDALDEALNPRVAT
jgi:ABC-type dipeptide/oligopeptide/nickel transport system permease subunit